jgi:hypothetical protein
MMHNIIYTMLVAIVGILMYFLLFFLFDPFTVNLAMET